MRVLLVVGLVICGVAAGAPAFDAARVEAARAAIAARNTKALLVIQGGRTVVEWYAPGAGADTKHFTASLAKALVGGTSLMIAMADGRMKADAPAATYIPAWSKDAAKSKITIRHLATHTSGVQDANIEGVPHDKLPGWMGAFWRRDPDPFSISLRDAPVLFEPGSQYHYSNPGMAALAYAVTSSLRGAPQTNIRELLRARLMKPLGIADGDWAIGYNGPTEIDGLKVYANWGGAAFAPRATARIGQWMMASGSWNGPQIVPARVVDAAVKYAGTALPKRDPDRYAPASTLGWYSNFDGVWPGVPRDAFAGAGAQHQVLLVVPSLDLVIVRNGGVLDASKPFWTVVYEDLFAPLMDAMADPPAKTLRAPYTPSAVIRGITFDDKIQRAATGSDNWPITWAADDHQYTSWGDGWGFEPPIDTKLSLGLSRIEGSADSFRGINLRSPSAERTGDGKAGPKASGMIFVDGVLYMWVRNAGNAQLVWSADAGRTWTWGFKLTESFGSPAFLNFGKDNAGARDQYVYTYSQDGASAYESADGVVLARVPKTRLRERRAWEFFAGLGSDGAPRWSSNIAERKPVFVFPGNCQRTDAVYNAGLKRYLLAVSYGHRGAWGIFDAPEPWGPWTTAFHTDYWGLGETHGYRLPSKWISADGRTMALVFSGLVYDTVSYDAFCVRKMKLDVSRR